ncbi:MAG: N-formylglutamate amidohydrolase [Parvibaculales bacterium]
MQHTTQHKVPFRLMVRSDENDQPTTPQWVLTSPHSGHLYPVDFVDSARLSAHDLRRSEDAHVDRLVERAPQYGAAVMAAIYPRAYLDLNRGPYELDPSMFGEPLPDYAETDGPRVKSGLGTIARIVADRMPIYRDKLTVEEAEKRISEIHVPFHNKLTSLLKQAVVAHNHAYLLDIHSMPSGALNKWAARRGGKDALPDIVIGDRFGTSCRSELTLAVEAFLKSCGYKVARNSPYAGGYITQTYGLAGRKVAHVQSLQIELSRHLYMDEETYLCHEGFARLQEDLTAMIGHLKSAMTGLPRAAE